MKEWDMNERCVWLDDERIVFIWPERSKLGYAVQWLVVHPLVGHTYEDCRRRHGENDIEVCRRRHRRRRPRRSSKTEGQGSPTDWNVHYGTRRLNWVQIQGLDGTDYSRFVVPYILIEFFSWQSRFAIRFSLRPPDLMLWAQQDMRRTGYMYIQLSSWHRKQYIG